jgi:hypothetical protein
VVGVHFGWGTLGLRSWEAGIAWHARREGFGGKTNNRAAGARFWRTQCVGAMRQVEGTISGWGKLGLRWLGCAIK